MSSQRPQELVRKALASGYGDRSADLPFDSQHDGTEILCVAGLDLELGDWVRVVGAADGHLQATVPSAAGESRWIGVVQHKVVSGKWCRVKTAGCCHAKVNNAGSKTAGDKLAVQAFVTHADDVDDGEDVCGVFLRKMGSDAKLSWVRIGGGAVLDPFLKVDHHVDEDNTRVVDTTDATARTGYLWHVWKVNLDQFTGGEPRLMMALGGGTTHGQTNREGYGWTGYIQPNVGPEMGFGRIGGHHSGGQQGVLGAEGNMANSEHNPGRMRVNVRSLAGYNVNDRYGFGTPLVWPIGIGAKTYVHPPQPAVWKPHSSCYTEFGCQADVKWWAGAFIWNEDFPGVVNGTGWVGQWQCAVPTERNCITVGGVMTTPTPPSNCDFPCSTITNPAAIWTNAYLLNGPYENIIPYGHVACTGRLEGLDGLVAMIRHYQNTIKWLYPWMALIDTLIHCIDTRLTAKFTCVNNALMARQAGTSDNPGCTWEECCDDFVTCRPTVVSLLDGPDPTDDCDSTAC
jgi:hypothetical protein